MHLIFIYGPPAVGKLTVAEELVKLTDYKLFHNHLTQDLAREIYPEFNQQRFDLADRLRLEVFEYASKNNTNLIFTFVYVNNKFDNKFVANTIKIVTKNNGRVLFVQLTATKEALLKRVTNKSRQKFYKITDKNILGDTLDKREKDPKVTAKDVLVINTENQKTFSFSSANC